MLGACSQSPTSSLNQNGEDVTIIATSIMYWWGLGFFGKTDRWQQILLVAGIYVCQIVFSKLWMSVFRIGPFEWIWRTLTYLRFQPLLRASDDRG